MSRILFHSRDEDTVEVLGSERAHMGCLTTDLACAVIPTDQDEIRRHFAPYMLGMGLPTGSAFPKMLQVMLAHGSDDVFSYDGEPVENFSLLLNTAIVVGSDPVCLMARLHAQCEIHGYVEGPDRDWLAGIIEQGAATGLFRQGAGWDGVIGLLRMRDDAPVVTSYTVTESFPNPYVCGWTPPDGAVDDFGEPDWDLWYNLPAGEQWDMAIEALRADVNLTPITPESLRGHLFGHGRTLIDVFAPRAAVSAG